MWLGLNTVVSDLYPKKSKKVKYVFIGFDWLTIQILLKKIYS